MRGGGGREENERRPRISGSAARRVQPTAGPRQGKVYKAAFIWVAGVTGVTGGGGDGFLSCLRLIVSPFIKVKRVFNAIVSPPQAFY